MTLLTLIFASLSIQAADVKTELNTAKALNDASYVTEVTFNKASSELSADGKSLLRDLLKSASTAGQVEQVKIVSWADSEYSKKKSLGNDARKLASQRGAEIRGYIHDNLPGVDTDLFNMAEQPRDLEKLLKTDDARLKRSLETAGLVGPKAAPGAARVSRALVMVIVK